MKILATLLMLGLSTWTFALNPSRTYAQLPDSYGMSYEVVKVKTIDGLELNTWHFKTPGNKGRLVLIAHNGEGNMADYISRVSAFTELGYSVVTFDYRGYGESSEFEIDPNMYIYPHFQDDMAAMIDYCTQNISSTLSIYGWGIGAGLGLGIGYNRPGVKQIIADTPFLSMEDLDKRFYAWDEPMEVPFAGYDQRYEPIYTMDLEPYKDIEKISLIVGSNDILFSAKDMQHLQEKRPKLVDKNILVVENPDRKDNFAANTEAYIAYLKTALGK